MKGDVKLTVFIVYMLHKGGNLFLNRTLSQQDMFHKQKLVGREKTNDLCVRPGKYDTTRRVCVQKHKVVKQPSGPACLFSAPCRAV